MHERRKQRTIIVVTWGWCYGDVPTKVIVNMLHIRGRYINDVIATQPVLEKWSEQMDLLAKYGNVVYLVLRTVWCGSCAVDPGNWDLSLYFKIQKQTRTKRIKFEYLRNRWNYNINISISPFTSPIRVNNWKRRVSHYKKKIYKRDNKKETNKNQQTRIFSIKYSIT